MSVEPKWPTVIKHSLQPSVGLYVCAVHCGIMADWIRMRTRFGFVDRSTGGVILPLPKSLTLRFTYEFMYSFFAQ